MVDRIEKSAIMKANIRKSVHMKEKAMGNRSSHRCGKTGRERILS